MENMLEKEMNPQPPEYLGNHVRDVAMLAGITLSEQEIALITTKLDPDNLDNETTLHIIQENVENPRAAA